MNARSILVATLVIGFGLLVGCGNEDPTSARLGKPAVKVWRVPGDAPTLAAAVASANPYDEVLLEGGKHIGVLLSKPLKFRGQAGATIIGGPAHPSGLVQGFRLLAGSDGSSFEHLRFGNSEYLIDLAIMNAQAVDGAAVWQCQFPNTIQGVSQWRGSDWVIEQNDFTDLRTRNGGGIAILVGDYAATAEGVRRNVIRHNTISGVLHVYELDGGGYDGSGIVLYADFRWGAAGAVAIADNVVEKNHISMAVDDPGGSGVGFNPIELTVTGNNPPVVIFGNRILHNDPDEVLCTPSSLADPNVNTIAKNRGQAKKPAIGEEPRWKVYGPDGLIGGSEQ